MDWKIWGRKAIVGTLAAAGLGGLAALTVYAQNAAKDPQYGIYVAAALPFIVHWIGMAQNYLKHAVPKV